MGLFDKLTGNKEVVLNSKSALLLACLTMVAADGDIDDDEIAIIRRIDGPNNTDAWSKAFGVWKKHHQDDCVHYACQFIDPDHIGPLVANLVDIAMADGQLLGDEQRLLELFVEKLQPDEALVRMIVEVISLKNSVTTL